MLSISDSWSVDHPYARKVRRATELAKERAPGLVIDGSRRTLQYGATVEEVVNLVAVGAAEAASLKRPE